MNDSSEIIARRLTLVATWLAIPAILVALVSTFPKVPFLPSITVGEEVLKPIAFFALISAVILSHSHYIKWFDTPKRNLGVLVDITLLVIVAAFTFTYTYEVIIEKPELFPDWLAINVDPMDRLLSGPPIWVIISAIAAVIVCLYLNSRVWGWPIVIVAVITAGYAVLAALSSHYQWAPDNIFLSYPLGARDPLSEIRKYLVVGDAHSILGLFVSILLRIVLPFILLGNLFAQTGGGKSLIKLAFLMTKNTRGGPAHGAVAASSLFGTVSGGPVVNVLATGVLTIPMMLRQKFSPVFAGGVEAAASSGGQIVPPVMGVAAFFLANFTGVAYSKVVIAALIPAALYYFCLFLSITLVAAKNGMQPLGNLPEELKMTRQDWWNLLIVIIPIMIIIAVLASEAFTVSAAGIFALIALIPLAFIDPNIRKNPKALFTAISDGAIGCGRILLLFIAVAIVDSSLAAIGFPNSFGAALGRAVSGGISIFGYQIVGGLYLLAVLGMTMVAALLLGMGMPTLPAYANVAIIMAGGLTALGLSNFTSNMFVFYFAVASAITPPVAVAAFAASSITNADPMRTGIAAVRMGLVLFIIPFVFAFYPELLLIEDAFIADPISGTFIASRPEGFDVTIFASILIRVIFAIYLLAVALNRFDCKPVSRRLSALLAVLAIAILLENFVAYLTAGTIALAIILGRRFSMKRESNNSQVEGVNPDFS